MDTLVCKQCNIEKQKTEFIKDNRIKAGVRNMCIKCGKEYQAKYRKENSEKRRKANKNWQKNNPDYAKNFREKYPERIKLRYKKGNENRIDYVREYSKKNKERIKEKSKVHYQLNKERKIALRLENRKINMDKIRETQRKYVKMRVATDQLFKLKFRLRSRTKQAFRVNKWYKASNTEQLLGCSFETVKAHMERQFKKGMNWGNHGNGINKWNIDHIIPLASAKTEEELVILCHYSNLQPLWSIENFRKNSSIPEGYQLKLTI